MKPTTLLIGIAEDHVMVRQALVRMLHAETFFFVVIEADNGKELLRSLITTPVDIVLLDLRMPVMDGKETLMNLKKLYPHIGVIILTGEVEIGFKKEYLDSGASAFLSKSEKTDKMLDVIYSVGKTCISVGSSNEVLTKRETEVLHQIVQRRSNNEIAESLYLSVRTIENHRYNIYRKTGVKSIKGLIMWARAYHLF